MEAYYEQIDVIAEEIQQLYEQKDIRNYTLKVHALKSSSRSIGAMELGEKAQELENAGKAQNIEFIDKNHQAFINEYLKLKELLMPLESFKEKEKEPEGDKPVADEDLMNRFFDDIRTAADAMDTFRIDEIFDKMKSYTIPEKDAELFSKLKTAANEFDYTKLLELIQDEI